jgi:hypothetical protein
MKPILIVENNANPLMVNESESSSQKNNYVLGGIFTEFDKKNRNERIYTADKFIPALTELNERIQNMGVVYGEFDHPDVFDTSLSRASHLVIEAKYVKSENRVDGRIKLLSTYWGKEAKSLVNDGCPIFVSSRAAGVTENDGSVSLKKLFTYDIVADPGFASAKMTSINESLGFNNKSNFRIYEVSNESKINELFTMNKNEFVTKRQLTDYSNYLIQEIATTKNQVKSAVKNGNLEPKKVEKLLEYYDELNNTNNQVVKYLDYLADKIQVVVNENKELRSKTEKIISHNDYLAENLERAINYSEYLAENLDKNISYSEYLAENVDKNISYSKYLAENLDRNISYSEYIAENLDRNISYSEYIAENLDKSIKYSEYIAENLDNSIKYSEYIAENLDTNIAYSEYLAENLDNSISYSEYLAENLDGNIAYSEYIAEHLDDNIAYSEYLAENVDKTISYTGLISEKLNNSRINESLGKGGIPTLEEYGFMESDEECTTCGDEPAGGDYASGGSYDTDEDIDLDDEAAGGDYPSDEDLEGMPAEVGEDELPGGVAPHNESKLSKQIDKLILEAKKRKVSENNDLNFLKFLNRSQVDSFYNLSNPDQETVKLYINERSYFSGTEVLRLISESLSAKNESLEDRLIRLMPDNIKPIWNKVDESTKKSMLSQARLHPDLDSEIKIEHFWNTRSFRKEQSTKKLVSHDALIQEDKLSDKEINGILERFKSI